MTTEDKPVIGTLKFYQHTISAGGQEAPKPNTSVTDANGNYKSPPRFDLAPDNSLKQTAVAQNKQSGAGPSLYAKLNGIKMG